MCRSAVFLIFLAIESIHGQGNDWLCESLICDPPKKCIIHEQVPQCLVESTPTPPLFGTINGGQPLFPNPSQTQTSSNIPSPLAPTPTVPPSTQSPQTTTPPSPFAPFLNLFGGGTPGAPTPTLIPPFMLPTLPTTAPPTTPSPVDVCSLPPVTGSCSRARIMWYYDNESRRCERFSWSGCGNQNRFASKMQCEQTCSQNSLFKRNF
ncbi:BPTI/Kunitz inhibitor domain-containing protein [Caenorhabditis elegans]|uniref:BPTI/Kunitz inhibitor domain-containing protein n=1 Tax=Caenorhabditis elegans TaxID=6239 RepID=I2HAB0_CAEEL|nr:BPTI/Kunitz inhibitor domain-containing protein [Caenorhabditis elegans]CCH63817.1 BPTI/Kunitz inhibitor domain-containing protein [Caenorhabditis elegans]|eukprot:NP_001255308.1 Uncharacterized protein CELE_C49H3.16 [Caenorhabditis elegans]